MGCRSGPVRLDDAAYRAIEREADRNASALAVTGAGIAAGVERIDGLAARVQSELDGLETAVGASTLPEEEKSALLLHASIAREEAGEMLHEVSVLRKDTGRLTERLAEQREIGAALSEEHDKREAAAGAVRLKLDAAKEELAKVKGRCVLYLAILIAVCIGVLGYIAFRALRFLRIIPV